MKNLIVLSILLIASASFCQKNTTPIANIELMSQKNGVLLKKSLEEVGKTGGIILKIYSLSNESTGEITKALRFEYPTTSSYSKISSVDYDEIDGLTLSMKKVMEAASNINLPTKYTEIFYKSNGGMEIGAYYQPTGLFSGWNFYAILGSYLSDSQIPLTRDRFEKLIALVEGSKAKF